MGDLMPDTHAFEAAATSERAFERLQRLGLHGYRPVWNPAARAIHLEHPAKSFRDARLVLYPDGQLVSLASTDEFLILPHETETFEAFLKTVPTPNFGEAILSLFQKPRPH